METSHKLSRKPMTKIKERIESGCCLTIFHAFFFYLSFSVVPFVHVDLLGSLYLCQKNQSLYHLGIPVKN